MELSTSAFADNGVIPPEFAFCAMDAATHVKLSGQSQSRFPLERAAGRHALAGAPVPRPGRAVARRRRQPGGPDRAGVAAARRFLPLGAGRPASGHAGRSRAASSRTASRARGKPGPACAARRAAGDQRLHRLVRRRQGHGRQLLRLRRPVPAVERRAAASLRLHAVRARRAAPRDARDLHRRRRRARRWPATCSPRPP